MRYLMIPVPEAISLAAFDPVDLPQYMECVTATIDLFHGTMEFSGAVDFKIDVEQLANSLIAAMARHEFEHNLPRQTRRSITQLSKKLEGIGY